MESAESADHVKNARISGTRRIMKDPDPYIEREI